MSAQPIHPIPLADFDGVDSIRCDAEFELTLGLSEVTQLLADESAVDADKALGALLSRVVDALPGAGHASLTERGGSTKPPVTVIATDPTATEVDFCQYRTGQGPCLEALEAADLLQVDDLSADSRWPRFSSEAVPNSTVRSVLSVPIHLPGHGSQSLNLYGDQTYAFDRKDSPVAYLAAAAAGLTLAAIRERQRADHLNVALESNRTIGAAMGILMAEQHWTADQAFAALRVTSQNSHRKLREVADEVLFTGALPAPALPRRRPEASRPSSTSPSIGKH